MKIIKKFKFLFIFGFLLSYLFIPIVFFFNYTGNKLNSIFYSTLIFISLIIFSEIIYILIMKISNKNYLLKNNVYEKEKFCFESHPYLPYVMKKNFLASYRTRAYLNNYKKNYYFPELKTNNFGFCNGDNGSRRVNIPKKEGLIRINCLGASTTGNYIEYDNKVYSYPLILENKLREEYPNKEIEVNNFGQGGYNSAEILINFILKVLDTNPDLIILYHGYNDIRSYLTTGFLPDYSHSRKNISEDIWKLKVLEYFPPLKLNFYKYLIQKLSIRNSLLELISKGKSEIHSNTDEGLKTFKRNTESIIHLCKANGIKIILSTFCLNISDDVLLDEETKKYKELVNCENEILENLAKKHNIPVVRNNEKIKKDETYFVDTIHFTPEGMHKLAENFFDEVKKII